MRRKADATECRRQVHRLIDIRCAVAGDGDRGCERGDGLGDGRRASRCEIEVAIIGGSNRIRTTNQRGGRAGRYLGGHNHRSTTGNRITVRGKAYCPGRISWRKADAAEGRRKGCRRIHVCCAVAGDEDRGSDRGDSL